MPYVIMIAGPNGGGKSTSAPALLQNLLHLDNFVNADMIAKGLCAFEPEKAAIQAGRIMLHRMHTLAEKKSDFAFETTLASRTFVSWIVKLKKQGYKFKLIFLWLNSVELAVDRVRERVKLGGHFVSEVTVRRRYVSGLRNFFNLYKSLADAWTLYDNSNAENFSVIASAKKSSGLVVQNKIIWDELVERYSED